MRNSFAVDQPQVHRIKFSRYDEAIRIPPRQASGLQVGDSGGSRGRAIRRRTRQAGVATAPPQQQSDTGPRRKYVCNTKYFAPQMTLYRKLTTALLCCADAGGYTTLRS